MEDTLEGTGEWRVPQHYVVLILVLMEDTLEEVKKNDYGSFVRRLNPCFNGRYSVRYGKD